MNDSSVFPELQQSRHSSAVVPVLEFHAYQGTLQQHTMVLTTVVIHGLSHKRRREAKDLTTTIGSSSALGQITERKPRGS